VLVVVRVDVMEWDGDDVVVGVREAGPDRVGEAVVVDERDEETVSVVFAERVVVREGTPLTDGLRVPVVVRVDVMVELVVRVPVLVREADVVPVVVRVEVTEAVVDLL
jgi:hypothetical protein